MKLKISYLKWRAGRPRWEPGPTLRGKGWRGRDLKDEAGAWLELEAAIEAARALNLELALWRAGTPRKPPKPLRTVPSRSCQHLWDLYRQAPIFGELASATKRDYKNKIAIFLAEFGDKQIAALDKSHLYGWWEELYQARGHHMANGIIRAVRAMLSYAEKKGWRGDNPGRGLGLATPKPRQVFWTAAEIAAIVKAADRLRLASVGDAIIVALHSGQRLSDVLALPDRIFEASRIRLTQAKRGALVDAPMTPALIERVAAIKARRRIVDIAGNEALIRREDTGGPYDKYSFNKAFRQVRKTAAKACPSLAEKRFQDLRDTAVTRLALADCSLPQIAAITGHSPDSITQILKHYLVLQPEMADAAIAKLAAWLEQQEIAL